MGRIFNIGGPPPASLHDIAEMLVRIAGPPARYTTREFPADRATIDIGSYHADDSAFRAAAGWEPRCRWRRGSGVRWSGTGPDWRITCRRGLFVGTAGQHRLGIVSQARFMRRRHLP